MINNKKASVVYSNWHQNGCGVSRCLHPKDRESIEKKLEIWRKFNNVSGMINTFDANVIEELSLTVANICEIYLSEHLYEGQWTRRSN